MEQTVTYSVPGIHCENCKQRIEDKVSAVTGVNGAKVDVDHNLVTVRGGGFSDQAVRSAIEEAGYKAE